MKISLKPTAQTFKLSIDPEGQATVTVRQARTGDLVRLGNLFSEQTQIWDDEQLGKVMLQRKWNPEELMRERAFCTLVGIDLEDEETGEPIFRFREGKNGPELAMTRNAFCRAWDALPVELTQEIYNNVLEVNPQWDPARQGE